MSSVPWYWHLITGEYPPDPGGVADHTALLARSLADTGVQVHIWSTGHDTQVDQDQPGIAVHRIAGRFGPIGLFRLDRALNKNPRLRTILIQYTPHAFGWKAMNVPFTLWVLHRRAFHGDDVRVLFHEVSVPFVLRPVQWNVVAAANRVMAAVLVLASRASYVTIPAWEQLLRGLGGRRRVVRWCPVPANVPSDADPKAVSAIRECVTGGTSTGEVVGHFGTHSPLIAPLLVSALSKLMVDRPHVHVLAIGRGGDELRENLLATRPDWTTRVTTTGGLPPIEVSAHLRACDLVIQPFLDGISTRRGSVMAALANRVPVVTNFGGLSEPIWKSEIAVALAEPADLADVAGRLLDDASRRTALGEAGRNLYERRFDIQHTVATLLAPLEAARPITTHRPIVAFVVNGGPDSAMGVRARAFADRLVGRFTPRLIFREGGKARAALRMLRQLFSTRPAACYVLDIGAAGVIAASTYKTLTGTPFVIDTGDAVVELGRVLGRGSAGMLATRTLEDQAFRAAAAVVVRGTDHAELLAKRGIHATVIPDGVDTHQFTSVDSTLPERPLTIGLVGSSVWVASRQTCYGWELVELIRLLRDRLPVQGLMIGDGSGIDVLRRRCAEYGIANHVTFAGRIPYSELPTWLQRGQIWLSTQTDDTIGRVRTTGKLPLYLAAGRFVLASRVGEAAHVLPPEMLVDFSGDHDTDYPAKLAKRIEELVAAGTDFTHRPECVAIARDNFDYNILADRVASVLESSLRRRGVK